MLLPCFIFTYLLLFSSICGLFDRDSLYVVRGTDAAIVERFLRKEFQMSPLRFVCCGWEPSVVSTKDTVNTPRYGIYKDRDSYDCEISMTSGETLEKNWHLIPRFYVRVTKYLGTP